MRKPAGCSTKCARGEAAVSAHCACENRTAWLQCCVKITWWKAHANHTTRRTRDGTAQYRSANERATVGTLGENTHAPGHRLQHQLPLARGQP